MFQKSLTNHLCYSCYTQISSISGANPASSHQDIVSGVPPAGRAPHHDALAVPQVVLVLPRVDVAVVVRGRAEAVPPTVPPRPGVGVRGAGVSPVPVLLAGMNKTLIISVLKRPHLD